MKNTFKNYMLNVIWIVLFAAIALFFTLKGDFKSILEVLCHINAFWFFIILCLGILPYLFEGMVLKIFANIYNKNYSLKQGFVNAMSGGFFCGITPFSSGGQFAQVYIFKKQGVSTTNSVGILLMCFIIYQVTMVAYTLLVLIFKFNKFFSEYSSFVSVALIGFLINAIVITALLTGAVSSRFQNFLTGTVLKIGYRLHIIKNYDYAKLNLDHKLEDFRTELAVMKHHKPAIIKSSICIFLKLTVQYSIPFFTMLALGQNLPFDQFSDYLGICAFIYMITAFIPIPGASGGSEGTYALLYSYLMGSVLASSSMLIWRFATYYLVMFVGAIVFAMNKEINQRHRKGDIG